MDFVSKGPALSDASIDLPHGDVSQTGGLGSDALRWRVAMGWEMTEAQKRQQATHRCRFCVLCHLDTQHKGSAGLGRSLYKSKTS